MPPPRSILIIKPSSLGDVVHTLPAVARVRKKWPGAKIRWLVNPEWAPVLEDNPDIDEVIEFPRKNFRGVAGWARLPRWIRELRERVQPDLVLDFQGLLRSALVARFACSTGGESWGTSDSRECARFFHGHIVRVPPRCEPVHAVNRYLALVAALGCDIAAPLEWRLPAGTQPADCPHDFILLHPFSRGQGKSLTADEVTAICRELSPAKIVIAGRSEAALSPQPNTVNLLNKTTLPELCWMLRRAAFVVSVDSGPMHIAAAVSQNLLSIHTWSDPRKVGPFQPSAWIWKDGKIARMADFPNGVEVPRDGLGRWIAEKNALPAR
ncbi:MAG: glycosyltransferase family 9 protein [Chthoniobacteraceae bacterium]